MKNWRQYFILCNNKQTLYTSRSHGKELIMLASYDSRTFKTKKSRAGLIQVSLFWEVLLCNLRPSIINSAPCDRIVQRAFCQTVPSRSLPHPINYKFMRLPPYRRWKYLISARVSSVILKLHFDKAESSNSYQAHSLCSLQRRRIIGREWTFLC